MRCARCGRRASFYLTEGGPYLAHVIPLALHRATLMTDHGNGSSDA